MPGKQAGDRAHGLADRERVLQQPVAVGLVVELRRRRRAEALPHLGALAVERVQQQPQVRVAAPSRSGWRRSASILSALERRASTRSASAYSPSAAAPSAWTVSCGAPALVQTRSGRDAHDSARLRRSRGGDESRLPSRPPAACRCGRAASVVRNCSPLLLLRGASARSRGRRRRRPSPSVRSRMKTVRALGAGDAPASKSRPFPFSDKVI